MPSSFIALLDIGFCKQIAMNTRTNETTATKDATKLTSFGIAKIVCIGETEAEAAAASAPKICCMAAAAAD